MSLQKHIPMPFFFYGTLRSDEWRYEGLIYDLLRHCKRREIDITRDTYKSKINITTAAVPGTLWALRMGFPGAVFDTSANTLVHGEVVTFPENVFDFVYSSVCLTEGYLGVDNRDNGFNLIIVEATDAVGNTHQCISFQPSLTFLNRQHTPEKPWYSKPMEIENGRWFSEKHARFAEKLEEKAWIKYIEYCSKNKKETK